jgi:succinate dehydrogenase flavin-adding protein (antitoxin of CptAB toxin-antitoxin module)
VDRAAYDRLRWHCRRGLLELDLVLERFLQQDGAKLSEAEFTLLCELLDFDDNDLWDVVNGRSEGYDPKFRNLVARLRAV